jgi:hypothetical protein
MTPMSGVTSLKALSKTSRVDTGLQGLRAEVGLPFAEALGGLDFKGVTATGALVVTAGAGGVTGRG